MNNHIRRIEALEVTMNPPVGRRWHRLFQQAGQTRVAAIGVYEAQYGPMGEYDAVILRRIVTV